MDSAQRGNEFVAHFAAQCARLHEAKVVGIRGLFAHTQDTLVGLRTGDACSRGCRKKDANARDKREQVGER